LFSKEKFEKEHLKVLTASFSTQPCWIWICEVDLCFFKENISLAEYYCMWHIKVNIYQSARGSLSATQQNTSAW